MLAVANGVTVEWQTVQEVDLAGFHLYRLSNGTNTFTRITDTLITTQGSADTGAVYQYVDHPGQGQYVYQLVSVSTQGEEQPHAQVEVAVEQYQLFLPLSHGQ